MERLLVFADFNRLVSPELVGELCYEKLRGSDSYAFKDGDNAQDGYGYLDIVDFILQGCCDVEKNQKDGRCHQPMI